MNTKFKIKMGVLASALLFSLSSHAALVESDLYENGDGLATLDTNTGVEWMDLTQTKGMSANEVLADPRFSGWRFPTIQEYTTLIESYLPDVDHYDTLSYYPKKAWPNPNTEIAQIKAMLSFFVGNERDADYQGLYGMFVRSDGNIGLSGGLLTSRNQYGVHRDAQFYGLNNSAGGGFDSKNGAYSMYLVSDGGHTIDSINDPSININNPSAPINDVSAPLTGIVGGLSLIALGLRLRQRN